VQFKFDFFPFYTQAMTLRMVDPRISSCNLSFYIILYNDGWITFVSA